MLKIVFFGTPSYVLPVLEKLNRVFREKNKSPIVAVVTQPPKPTGRKQRLEYSAVDRWAHDRKIPVYYEPFKIARDGIEADIAILAAYGAIISDKVINHFPKGVLNIHPSLLPKFRGASPIQAQIISAPEKSGATIIKLDELMDHGDIITQFEEEITPDDTTESLRTRLFVKSADVLVETIKPYLNGKIKPKEQNHKEATFTRLIKKEHGFVPSHIISALINGNPLDEDWEIGLIKDYRVKPSAEILERMSKALSPWPGLWSKFRSNGKERRIKLLELHNEKGMLIIDRVQVEARNPVTWNEFLRGYPKAEF